MTLRTNENWLAYKNQHNLCTSLRRRAIKSYYSTKTDSLSLNPREFWRVFSPLFKSRGGGTSDIFLQENGLPIGDKQQIANIFNEFFVNVADGMEEPDWSVYGSDFSYHPSIINIRRHVNVNGVDNFCFEETNSKIVTEVVKSLSTSKAIGHDNIPIRLVKDGISVLSGPLSTLYQKFAIHLVGNRAKFLPFLKRIFSI